ncbi:hypothetical protein AB0I77_18925 [Streptomyces sp. NPDC050619]|uniref:hypothetical protein n=1 Tax=Streptomyces sp. NPDC050619 TaxID=3157214 RepID=UPI0034161BC6
MGLRLRIRTTGLLVTAAFMLLIGGTQQTAAAQDGLTTATDTVSTPQSNKESKSQGPRVSGQVTRLLFKEPRTLDELTDELSGRAVLQLRYTGDVGGVSQSGPGSSVTKAVADLRRDTVARWDAEPLVYMAVLDGKLPADATRTLSQAGVAVKYFASDTSMIDQLPKGTLTAATKATRAREAELAKAGVPAPEPKRDSLSTQRPKADGSGDGDVSTLSKVHPWSPIGATMQAWVYPDGPQDDDYPNTFYHQFQWNDRADLDAFGDDFGYEHNVSLYNEDDISGWTRPYCAPWDSIVYDEYENFWAAWDVWAFKWNAVSYGWDIPGEAAPYWDWDDVTDPCNKIDFSVGIGYPQELSPDTAYSFWIYAMDGDQDSSPMEMGAQKLSNDCNNLGMDPGSSCMGLNANREGSGTELIVNKSREWTVPGCVGWYDGNPSYTRNGELFCPANG